MLSRLINRAFQLIRMITIARWLGPDEMGVYAVAALVLSTIEQFSETGLRPAIIQRQGDISPYLLPVRTVQAVRGLLIGIGVYISAPWLASFFKSPNSLHIVRIVALLPIINGLEPLYIILARKELKFARIVILQLAASGISLVVGICAAYLKPDAWALVWASLTGAMITTVGASIMSNREILGFTFNWRSLKEIRDFGFWMMIFYVLTYAFVKGGDWVIGRMLDVKILAIYQMSFLVCTTVPSEIGGVISQLSFPVFSKLQNDQQRLHTTFLQAFGMISIITFCLAGLVVACAPDFYGLVLGGKWLSGLPFVPWLTIWGVTAVFLSALTGMITALGKQKLSAFILLYAFIILMICIYPVTHRFGAIGAAALLASIGVIMQLFRYMVIGRLLTISFFKVIKHTIIPAIACVISIIIAHAIRAFFSSFSSLKGLILSTLSVLISYIFVLTLCNKWLDPAPRVLLQRLRTTYTQSKQ
jgi:lipopolysaccharide exporter